VLSVNLFADDMSGISNQLNVSRSDTLRFTDFCRPRQYSPTSVALNDSYEPQITFFQLTNELNDILSRLSRCQKSVIFKHTWDRFVRKLSAKSAGDESVTVAQIVWKPVDTWWGTFCKTMISGEISFSTLDENLDIFQKRYDEIRRELQIVCSSSSEKVAAERCDQIQQYHALADYSNGAKIMLELRDSFQLMGNFSIVDSLTNLVSFVSC
jgi:hypothetical protein